MSWAGEGNHGLCISEEVGFAADPVKGGACLKAIPAKAKVIHPSRIDGDEDQVFWGLLRRFSRGKRRREEKEQREEQCHNQLQVVLQP